MAEHREPTVHDVGEFALIDRLVAGRRMPGGVPVGPGDDAAIVDAPDRRVVITTDMLVAGRHFRLDWSTPHEIGRKAIAQNGAGPIPTISITFKPCSGPAISPLPFAARRPV